MQSMTMITMSTTRHALTTPELIEHTITQKGT